jgi:hypothetical protein
LFQLFVIHPDAGNPVNSVISAGVILLYVFAHRPKQSRVSVKPAGTSLQSSGTTVKEDGGG